jgi:NAD-dependent deacetylase
MKKKLVVLTGAGISAESGLKTFRDSDGLWEGHNVMEVASPEGWQKNPELVLDFYNKRRQQLKEVKPNLGHRELAQLQIHFDVHIITQNVDDLHERAGSKKVLHLHGELLKVRSTKNPKFILEWEGDLNLGDMDSYKNQLRPHIVWFGEAVPAFEEAIAITETADYFAVIGTSLQVYPAAGLTDFVPIHTPIFYIDPNPIQIPNLRNQLETFPMLATTGIPLLKNRLLAEFQ